MSRPLELVRAALAGSTGAWVVGGAVRDELLGRPVDDIDLAVQDAPEAVAAAIARAADRGAARFALSDDFGTWRVRHQEQGWQVDVSPLRGGAIEADLALRDLTINAMAQRVGDDAIVDPTGGRDDLAAGRARIVSAQALADDPLRCLRVARFATELRLAVDPATIQAVRRAAPGMAGVAGERVFAELKRIVAADDVRRGLDLMGELGVMAQVLPELTALDGVEQNRYHNADVLTHTLAVLDETLGIEADPGAVFGAEHADAVRALLDEPLADELTRREGLRLGALLHDAAKPQTRAVSPEGETLGFPRHDVVGEEVARGALARLKASERLRAHVAALTRHHLRLGFLVHHRPLTRRRLYEYLVITDPVEVDVTLLSTADRLATRGRKAEEATRIHVELAREVLGEALRWRAGETRPRPLLRGDELARELGIEPGPRLGELVAALAEAQFAGEVADRQEAVAVARSLLDAPAG